MSIKSIRFSLKPWDFRQCKKRENLPKESSPEPFEEPCTRSRNFTVGHYPPRQEASLRRAFSGFAVTHITNGEGVPFTPGFARPLYWRGGRAILASSSLLGATFSASWYTTDRCTMICDGGAPWRGLQCQLILDSLGRRCGLPERSARAR